MDSERHIWVRLWTANVDNLISLRRETNQIPLSVGDVLLRVAYLRFHLNVNSKPIVSPRAKFHGTKLREKIAKDKSHTTMKKHSIAGSSNVPKTFFFLFKRIFVYI